MANLHTLPFLNKRHVHALWPTYNSRRQQWPFNSYARDSGSPQEVLGYEEDKPLPKNNLGIVFNFNFSFLFPWFTHNHTNPVLAMKRASMHLKAIIAKRTPKSKEYCFRYTNTSELPNRNKQAFERCIFCMSSAPRIWWWRVHESLGSGQYLV